MRIIKGFIILALLLVFAYTIYVLVISPETKPSITQKSPSVTSEPSKQIIAKAIQLFCPSSEGSEFGYRVTFTKDAKYTDVEKTTHFGVIPESPTFSNQSFTSVPISWSAKKISIGEWNESNFGLFNATTLIIDRETLDYELKSTKEGPYGGYSKSSDFGNCVKEEVDISKNVF